MRVLFLDVDGTLTDGVIGFGKDGDTRSFWIRDGIALEWARDLGVLPVVISGRDSQRGGGPHGPTSGSSTTSASPTRWRWRSGCWAASTSAGRQCVMVGDDLPGHPLLKRVGWPIAVGDCAPEVQARRARTVLASPGGRGAVREAVEMVLRHNGIWARVLERYEAM